MRLLTKLSTASLIVLMAAGCPSRKVAEVNPEPNKEAQKKIPVELNRQLDILFIVDNSGSMEEEQQSLAQNFPRFINVLDNIEGGLPDVHIGVISTDMGGGADAACVGNGDNGTLQSGQGAGNTSPCNTPNGKWIEDIADGNGGRITNYSGTLAENFSCIAALGKDGCGFEQPLESMQRALENPANDGFLRPDAFLAIIFITDEDDCSTNNPQFLLNPDPSQDNINSTVGPLASYRCFEFGIECDPDTPRVAGERIADTCIPREDSPYMRNVKQYADFLKQDLVAQGKKRDQSQIIVAGIIAPPSPVFVEAIKRPDRPPEREDALRLSASCQSNNGEGFPGIRLQAFFDLFPGRNTVTTICNEDLSDALDQIAELLRRIVGTPCLADGVKRPAECAVFEVTNPGTENETQGDPYEICNDAQTNKPCYIISEDEGQCGLTDTNLPGLAIEIVRDETESSFGVFTEIRCVSE